MSSTALFAQASDLTADDYCVLGLATCFVREDGDIEQLTVLEPIPGRNSKNTERINNRWQN